MSLTNAFHEAVNTGNVRRVRIMMKNSLLVDLTFTEFSEMERAAANMEGLYDLHDGRELNPDKSTWDNAYMDKLMVQVVSNFSRERLAHIKEVVRYLNPVSSTSNKKPSPSSSQEAPRTERTEQRTNYQAQKSRDQKNGSYLGAQIATGAVAGAVVGGVVASIAGATAVGGAIVGGIIGGVAVTVVVNGGK